MRAVCGFVGFSYRYSRVDTTWDPVPALAEQKIVENYLSYHQKLFGRFFLVYEAVRSPLTKGGI